MVSLDPLDAINFPVPGVAEDNSTVRNSSDIRHAIDVYLDNADVVRKIFGATG